MDDIQLLLYIAFGVIYVLSRAFRKKKEIQEDTARSEQETPRPVAPSFEDLLREFAQGNTSTTPYNQPSEAKTVEEIELENDLPTDEEIDQIYQESIKQAEVGKEKPEYVSKFQRFDEFEDEEDESMAGTIMKDFEDFDGLKKAVIYKEILDRKY